MRRNRFVSFCLLVGILSSSEVFSQSVSIQFESSEPILVPITPSVTPSGNLAYVGSKTIQETLGNGSTLNHVITWNVVVPGNNQGIANELLFNGNMTVLTDANTLGSRSYTVHLVLPSPASYGSVFPGSSGSVKLVTNADGGVLLCSTQPTGDYLLALMGDENVLCVPFFCPFVLATGGGQMTSPFIFNVACAGQTVGSVSSTVGMKFRARVSAGDKATASMAPAALQNPNCPADFNLDGAVNANDFGLFLGAWGLSVPNSIYDLNKDGSINQADLGILLAAMGNCG